MPYTTVLGIPREISINYDFLHLWGMCVSVKWVRKGRRYSKNNTENWEWREKIGDGVGGGREGESREELS